jgi:hypothetical protein
MDPRRSTAAPRKFKGQLVMEWTVEADAQLRELHAKRVSSTFIASWMRWPSLAVRTRLIELGLEKSPAARRAAIAAATAKSRPSQQPLQAVEARGDAFSVKSDDR